ncbi:MAG TPA: hypothetical protein VGE27_11040 [Gemmatimonas sp.]|uniref:hypothetical protein n=1 Tax=Gemmatimonas sp. TaxID=1962908 RepID=UPI002ED95F86
MQSGLLHLALRFRRFLGMALGVHVLVTALITALAACNPVLDATSSAQSPRLTAQSSPTKAHSDSHGTSHTAASPTSDYGSHASHDVPSSNDGTTSHHHGSTTVACPMSMACAVSAMASEVPSLDTRATLVASALVLENDSLPRSSRLAPEPPPPRA